MTNTLSRGRVLAIVLLCCGVIGFGQNQDGKDAVHPDVEKPPLVWPRVEIPAGFEQIAQIAISPDGRRALTTRNEGIPLVTLWNLDTGEVIRKERVSLSRIGLRSASVGLSPDGQHAFWVTPKDSQHELNLWHVESGRKVKTFAVSKKGVVAAAFSEDGKYLASADYDGLITLWEVVSGQAVRTFQGSRPSVVLFSPDGKYLLADELGQKAVWLWDRAGAKEPRKLPIAWFGGYWRVAFSSTGSNLLVGHSLGPIQVLDLPSGQAVAEVLAGRWVFAPLPDGKHLVLGGQPREGLKLVDLATGKVTRTSERVRHAPDQIVVSGDGRRVLYSSGDFLMLWDLEKGEKVRMLARGPRHPDPITQLAFLSDNKRLVVSRKEDVTLWDAERGKEIHKFDLGPLHNVAVRIVPDGKAVLIDGWEENRREVGLWDVATGKPLWKLTGGRKPASSCGRWSGTSTHPPR